MPPLKFGWLLLRKVGETLYPERTAVSAFMCPLFVAPQTGTISAKASEGHSLRTLAGERCKAQKEWEASLLQPLARVRLLKTAHLSGFADSLFDGHTFASHPYTRAELIGIALLGTIIL